MTTLLNPVVHFCCMHSDHGVQLASYPGVLGGARRFSSSPRPERLGTRLGVQQDDKANGFSVMKKEKERNDITA